MGFSSMVLMLGNVAGPMIVGVMADHFGTYRYGFLTVAGLALVGSACFYFARRPEPPRGRDLADRL